MTDRSIWTQDYLDNELHLQFFRGDKVYLWQYRDYNTEIKYLLTAYYTKSIDRFHLLDILDEDDLFGIYTFDINDKKVSRDLLDSIIEIYFLENHVGISSQPNLHVMDIGAGYGRLAHRMIKSLPNIEYMYCTDAIPESTFISEYYLRFRGVNNVAKVIPLYDVEKTLASHSIDIATNIHSFQECTLGAIKWWLEILSRHRVKYLMVVANAGENLLSKEKDGSRLDFLPSIESYGYKFLVKQPKYLAPCVQKYGITPTYHFLFELK